VTVIGIGWTWLSGVLMLPSVKLRDDEQPRQIMAFLEISPVAAVCPDPTLRDKAMQPRRAGA
jgi:hypothetical protein